MNDKFPPSSPYHRPDGHPWEVTIDEVVHRGTQYEHAIEHLRCPTCKLEVTGPFFEQSSGARAMFYLSKPGMVYDSDVGHGQIPACFSALYDRRA